MANVKTENKEDKANKAEAAETPNVPVPEKDVSKSANISTAQEQEEGKANKDEALLSQRKRLSQDAFMDLKDKKISHNKQNRHISELLKGSKSERDVQSLMAENRKLKSEVNRLKNELEIKNQNQSG